jgi:hypothetical protein
MCFPIKSLALKPSHCVLRWGSRSAELLPLLVRLSVDKNLHPSIDEAIENIVPLPENLIPSLVQIMENSKNIEITSKAIKAISQFVLSTMFLNFF